MFEEKKVSIIMPAYNAKKNIAVAIESVLKQTYENWELIIVDDGSTDGTYDYILEKYSKEKRIKVYQMPENSGVAKTRNFAMTKASGQFLAFLDSDDSWLEQKLEKQVITSETQNAYFVCSSYYVMDEDGKMTEKKYNVPQKISYIDQLKGSRIGCLTVFLDRNIVGEFQMPNQGHEDYITWLELLKQFGPAYGIQEPLAYYRDGGNSLSSNKLRAAKWQYQIYRENENFGIIKSSYYFLQYAIRGMLKYK